MLSLIVSLKTLSKSCLNLTKSRFLITPLFFQHSHPHQKFTFEPILILGPSPKDAKVAQLFHVQEKVQQHCPVRQHPHPSKLHLRDAEDRGFLNYETAPGHALSCPSGSLQPLASPSIPLQPSHPKLLLLSFAMLSSAQLSSRLLRGADTHRDRLWQLLSLCYLYTAPRCVSFHPLPAGLCGANKGSYFWKRMSESGKYEAINTLLTLLQQPRSW